jgi:hypothetical protein
MVMVKNPPTQIAPPAVVYGDPVTAWVDWMNRVRAGLAALARSHTLPQGFLRDFFINHYTANEPALIELPHWPARDWTLESLKHRLGDTPVEVEAAQQSRLQAMPFSAFIDRIIAGDNDIYLTGRDAAQHRPNQAALTPLFSDLAPLPPIVSLSEGRLWIGGRTVTPLHHDFHNVLLCQVMGRKLVRMVRPIQVDRVGSRNGVWSELGWVTDEIAAARGLAMRDVILTPGQALFIPVGWWHCVRALEPSVSISLVSFKWSNLWQGDFPL